MRGQGKDVSWHDPSVTPRLSSSLPVIPSLWMMPCVAALSAEMDSEGALEEFGQRLCGVLSALGEGHFKCFSQQGDRRNLFLQQVIRGGTGLTAR